MRDFGWMTTPPARLWPSANAGLLATGLGAEAGQFAVVVLVGAFAGMMAGFVLSQLAGFLAMMAGRELGGESWPVIGAVAGGILFGCLALFGGKN